MRILLASDRLAVPGGSETYLLVLGRHLQRLGHEVWAVEGPGGTGTLAADAGLLIVDHPGRMADRPDRAIVQDAIVAGEVASAWPDVPQLAIVHSGIHDLQLPSALPSSVAALVVLNDRLLERAESLAEGRPVHRLTQPVDVGHFSLGPPPRRAPRQLLLLGNNRAEWRADGLRQACEARGIEVARVGAAAGNIVTDPVQHLRGADIVVGYGRSVLEAMACGRAALVFDRFGSDGWVTADTYAALEATGFNGAAGLDRPGRDTWDDVLDAYDPAYGAVGHDLAFRHHDARSHTASVLALLEGLGPVEPAEPATAYVLARIWREQWRWERQALAWAQEVDDLRTQAEHLEQELEAYRERAERSTAHVQHLERQVEDLRRARDAVLSSRSYRLGRRVARIVRPKAEG